MLARRFVAMHQATRSARSRLFSPALAARHLLLTSATDISMINIHTAAVLRRHARVRVLCDVSAFRSVCRSSVISVACTHPVCAYTQPGVIGRSSRATSALCLLVFSHRELPRSTGSNLESRLLSVCGRATLFPFLQSVLSCPFCDVIVTQPIVCASDFERRLAVGDAHSCSCSKRNLFGISHGMRVCLQVVLLTTRERVHAETDSSESQAEPTSRRTSRSLSQAHLVISIYG